MAHALVALGTFLSHQASDLRRRLFFAITYRSAARQLSLVLADRRRHLVSDVLTMQLTSRASTLLSPRHIRWLAYGLCGSITRRFICTGYGVAARAALA